MSSEKLLVEVLGWIGSGILVFAYLLLSTNKISSSGIGYQALNVAGSVLLIINTFYNRSFPAAGLNIVWLFIGAITILRTRQYKKKL